MKRNKVESGRISFVWFEDNKDFIKTRAEGFERGKVMIPTHIPESAEDVQSLIENFPEEIKFAILDRELSEIGCSLDGSEIAKVLKEKYPELIIIGNPGVGELTEADYSINKKDGIIPIVNLILKLANEHTD